MNAKVIQAELQSSSFKPFAVVTASGDRYKVLHPELAVPTKLVLFVFERDSNDEINLPVKIGYTSITALEPIEQAA